MEVVGLERLEKFGRRHAAARKPVRQWLDVAEAADWQTPAEYRKMKF